MGKGPDIGSSSEKAAKVVADSAMAEHPTAHECEGTACGCAASNGLASVGLEGCCSPEQNRMSTCRAQAHTACESRSWLPAAVQSQSQGLDAGIGFVLIPPSAFGDGSSLRGNSKNTPIPTKEYSASVSDPAWRVKKASFRRKGSFDEPKVFEMLTSDICMEVFGRLQDDILMMSMCVCKTWKKLAGSKDLWKNRGQINQSDHKVNWAAFKNLGVLRCKGHSTVIKCQRRIDDIMLVVKRIHTRVHPSAGEQQEYSHDQGFPVRYLREVSLLRASDHPNVMKLKFVSYQDGNLDLFSEYVGQNVEDYLEKMSREHVDCFRKDSPYHRMTMKNCRNFMRQILSAVCYCHTRGILLRDIKPRNVMLQEGGEGVIKLTGFALGRFASLPAEPLTREVVTLSYRAPEILLGGQSPVYSAPVDMWSVGCTLAEIASGRTLFEGDSEIGQLFCIFRLLGTPTEDMWTGVTGLSDFLDQPPQWKPLDLSNVVPLCPDGIDLLSQMLRYNPARRISAKDALQHPYFSREDKGEHRVEPAKAKFQCCEGECGVHETSGLHANCSMASSSQVLGEGAAYVGSSSNGNGHDDGCMPDHPEQQAGAIAALSHQIHEESLAASDWGALEAALDSDAPQPTTSERSESKTGENEGDASRLSVGVQTTFDEPSLSSSVFFDGNQPSSAFAGAVDSFFNSYGEDLRYTLLMHESAYMPNSVYLTNEQLSGFSGMRKILVEWLVEVVEEAHMKCETLFLAVNYLDRFLSQQHVTREQLQLVGITAILVASKHEELAPQSVQNLVIMTDNTYQNDEVLVMERSLLDVLDYSLTALTPLRALALLRLHTLQNPKFPAGGGATSEAFKDKLETEIWVFASYLLELALSEYTDVHTRPSVLTAAAVMLAFHTYEVETETADQGAGAASGEAGPVGGEAGPAFTTMSEFVWGMMGPALCRATEVGSGDEHSRCRNTAPIMKMGMFKVSEVMRFLHSYHASVQPSFATYRKYLQQKRLMVALKSPCPYLSLPTSVTLFGHVVGLSKKNP